MPRVRRSILKIALICGVAPLVAPASAQSPAGQPPPAAARASSAAPAATEKDPREGDPSFEQAQRLMKAVDAILQDTAKNRGEARKLPSEKDFLMKPLWTETKEDREKQIRDLLDTALGIVTDVPVVEVQKRIEAHRRNIREIEEQIVALKERQLTAPKEGMLPGMLTDTVASLGSNIEDSKKRIEENKAGIAAAKVEVQSALVKSGVDLTPEQLDLLLDSVLSGDLIRLVATFQAAKLIDGQLA